jgi:ribosomal protein S18 acetylase RimI-like enzyme
MDEVSFEQFGLSDLTEWLSHSNAEYIEERMAAGDTLDEAKANTETAMQRIFPNGVPDPGQLIGRILWKGEQIGELWVGRFEADPERWWVWDLKIDEAFRGRGFGRRAMLLAEELARTSGVTSIGLNVFAHNDVARNLYASLGYHETAVQMRKELTPVTDPERVLNEA